jgi:hypothetical protein
MGLFYKALTKVLPHVVITTNGKPYLTRFFLTGKPTYEEGEGGRLMLHYFWTSDRDRALHNHPAAGVSLILKGGYYEERRTQLPNGTFTPSRIKVCNPGSINKLGLADFHCATLLDERKGAWTLFYFSKRVRDWGFLTREDNKFIPWREFLHGTEDINYRETI